MFCGTQFLMIFLKMYTVKKLLTSRDYPWQLWWWRHIHVQLLCKRWKLFCGQPPNLWFLWQCPPHFCRSRLIIENHIILLLNSISDHVSRRNIYHRWMFCWTENLSFNLQKVPSDFARTCILSSLLWIAHKNYLNDLRVAVSDYAIHFICLVLFRNLSVETRGQG